MIVINTSFLLLDNIFFNFLIDADLQEAMFTQQ
jgi:hypothetical protein